MMNRLEIHEHLGRLLDSEQFVGSRSVAKLLAFCVDAALAGNEENLKETTIGIFCFGRSPGYDTKQDPIVRVTAGRLRKKLELFYEKQGEHHELRILLPKGTYVPRFNRCSNQSRAVGSAPDDNPVISDHALVAEAEPFSFERTSVKAPHASVTGGSWFRPAIWSFLAFLLMGSCGVFLARTGLLEDTKSATSQGTHPSRLGSLTADPAGMASGIPGKVIRPLARPSGDHVATRSAEDTVSVEPRL
jgi:hypothetical protein